jgi:hypothetical protein
MLEEMILQYLQILLSQQVAVEVEGTANRHRQLSREVLEVVVLHLAAAALVLRDKDFREVKARLERVMHLVQAVAVLAQQVKHLPATCLVKQAMDYPLFSYQIYRHKHNHYMAHLAVHPPVDGLRAAARQVVLVERAKAVADLIQRPLQGL